MAGAVSLTIDGRPVTVESGTTVLAAARSLGIRIPTLCHVDGFEPSASCFLCAVQVEGKASLAPSCAMPVAQGMVVHTASDVVRAARRTALELLLSDHAGDCVGPCMTGCPARFDIPGFLTEVAAGADRRAAEIASDFLVLPAALGRICPRLCEQRCHRCEAESALSVGSLHRFAADQDMASTEPYVPQQDASSGKRVAVVGAGPAGLSAAYTLLRRGHAVVLFDEHTEPGGMLRYGIPAFRLPHDTLAREIDVIRSLGGSFRLGTRVGRDVTLNDLRGQFDAVFLAIGAQGSRSLGCTGEEHALPALEFLESVATGQPRPVGTSVVVVGGGNTAMDAARTAVRLGAERVTVLYRRSRREMPCLMAEVEAAEAEGVHLDTLVAPTALERTGDGLRLTCVRMTLGAADASGRAAPVPVSGSEFTIDATCVIAAIGQTVTAETMGAGAPRTNRSGVQVDPATLATNLPGVFAGGDGVTGPNLAVHAVAAGKLAAVSIDQFLGGRPVVGAPEMVNVLMGRLEERELAAFLRDVEQAPRAPMPERPVDIRIRDFVEVEQGYASDVAAREAARCMHCGCWKATTCQLRQYATEYGADPSRFAGARRSFDRDDTHPTLTYEPGKCILCGACVTVAREAGDGLGLAIVGRGFSATVAVPLRGSLVEGLPSVAARVADVCPTGAFGLKSAHTHPPAPDPRVKVIPLKRI